MKGFDEYLKSLLCLLLLLKLIVNRCGLPESLHLSPVRPDPENPPREVSGACIPSILLPATSRRRANTLSRGSEAGRVAVTFTDHSG